MIKNNIRAIAFFLTAVLLSAFILSASVFAASVSVRHQKDGSAYLADSKGMTLYYYKEDAVNHSNCMDDCLKEWHIFYTTNFILPSDMNPEDLAIITRDDGKDQIVYKGYPLYFYTKDKKSGDMLGNKVNNVWFIVDPENFNP